MYTSGQQKSVVPVMRLMGSHFIFMRPWQNSIKIDLKEGFSYDFNQQIEVGIHIEIPLSFQHISS